MTFVAFLSSESAGEASCLVVSSASIFGIDMVAIGMRITPCSYLSEIFYAFSMLVYLQPVGYIVGR
jgi:hypothetical protein